MNNFIPHPDQSIEDREQLKFKPDINNDNAVNVLSANIEFLLEQILDALDITPGESVFDQYANANFPIDTLTTLFSVTVPSGFNYFLSKISVSCRSEGEMFVLVNSNQIGYRLTGAASPNAEILWSPRKPVLSGDLIEVKFKTRQGSPIRSVGAEFMALKKSL